MGYELKSARYLAREVILQAVLPGDHYRFIPKLMASMYASLD